MNKTKLFPKKMEKEVSLKMQFLTVKSLDDDKEIKMRPINNLFYNASETVAIENYRRISKLFV